MLDLRDWKGSKVPLLMSPAWRGFWRADSPHPSLREVQTLEPIGCGRYITSDVLISPTVTHNGWSMVQALGGRTPVSQATGLTTTNASVTLSWNDMASPAAFISETTYNLYRASTSGGQNFSSPLAKGITGTSYTDTSVSVNTTYYYVVKPVLNSVEYSLTASDGEIKVLVPPVNMSLVHRWMANAEICGLMGRSPDRSNNYRCAYTGPGNTGGYFDLGHSLFFDTVGVGCNYTMDTACDSQNGCLGTAAPSNLVGNDGDVFYDRIGKNCYLKVAGVWNLPSSLSGSQFATLGSNSPGLPPLTNITQNATWSACQAMKLPNGTSKRLPTRKERVAAAAWPASYSDTVINSIESGSSNTADGYCASTASNGLTYDNNVTPAQLETLPNTLSSAQRTVRTGSTTTQHCVSRYGIQDLIGNMWEFTSDQLGSCNTVTNSCVGITSTLDSSNSDLAGFLFDGTQGPGGGSTVLNYWDLSTGQFNTTNFIVPIGIPVVTGASSTLDYLTIGTGSGQFNSNAFHGDFFWFSSNNAYPTRALSSGGYEFNGNGVGRFALRFDYSPTTVTWAFGFRCDVNAD